MPIEKFYWDGSWVLGTVEEKQGYFTSKRIIEIKREDVFVNNTGK